MTAAQRIADLEARLARLEAAPAAPAAKSPAKGFPEHLKPTHACEVDDACKFMSRTAARAKVHGAEGHNFTRVNHKKSRAKSR